MTEPLSTADTRRREATRSFIRYFIVGLLLVGCLSGLTIYSLSESRAQRHETLAIRTAYCQELEKLKTQNREDLRTAKKNYARNLRILGIKDTKELRDLTEETWERKEARNKRKSCPYKA